MSSSVKDYYSSRKIGYPSEISLRAEFNSLVTGSPIEIPKVIPLLLRVARRDSNDNLMPCECVDKLTREPDKERLCPLCMGDGYKWDERWEEAYRSLTDPKEVEKPAGLINVPLVVFYMRYNVGATEQDKIAQVFLDLEGLPKVPVKRQALYRIQTIEPYRLDNGRVEFLKIWTYREDVKRLNA
jgi:hypothetical protein